MGGERCVKPVLLSIMSLNKHLYETNVLLPHAVKSDETAVRKYPYPYRVSSNWRSTLPSLALFDRYCSITTPALSTAQDNIHSAITTLICVTRWYVTHGTWPNMVHMHACALSVCRHVPECINAEHACAEPACVSFITCSSGLRFHVQ